jgi:putative sugar O-methyltransferase
VSGSLTELKRIYDRCLAYAGAADASEHTSGFWAEILAGRENLPDFNDMLVMRRGFTYPLADRAKVADIGAERAYAQAAHEVVRRDVPASFLLDTHESPVGCPIAFDFGEYTLSAGGLVNALTAYRIVSWCKRLGLGDRPLNILEIGAGYGQVALQLHRHLDIARYTVCDLPENGFLGAFYLQASLPGPAAYIEPDLQGVPDDARLVFAPPSSLDRLAGPYDLIVNSYSFQEMTAASVEGYLRHAAQTLTEDGVLYSLNAHGKAGIEAPRQYRVEALDLVSVGSVRRFPWALFGTVPYEFVQRRGERASVAIDADHLDAIGRAVQLGVQDEIKVLCDGLCGGTLAPEQAQWLSQAARLLRPGDPAVRLAAGRAMGELGVEPQLSAYLAGTLEFVRGDTSRAADMLARSLPGLGHTAARQRALLMLATTHNRGGNDAEGRRLTAEAIALGPHLGREIARWQADRDGLAEMLASTLGLPTGGWPSRARLARSALRGLRLRLRRGDKLHNVGSA